MAWLGKELRQTLVQRLVTGLQDQTLTFLFRYCFQAVVYAIWHEINSRRVGEAPQSPARFSSIWIGWSETEYHP